MLAAGDVNGDGLADVIVGAPGADDGGLGSGEAYVVFGQESGRGEVHLSSLDRTGGLVIRGSSPGEASGISVKTAGDINGDGFAEILVGSPGYAPPGEYSVGRAYVILGRADQGGLLDLFAFGEKDGYILQGSTSGDYVGRSVSGAGDVNGDGYDDIIIGAPYLGQGGPQSGGAFVLFGGLHGFENIDLDTLSPDRGFVIQGSGAELAGQSVAAAGDVNDDGFDDVIVGAFANDARGNDTGAAYVIFGTAPTEAVTRIGTRIGQTIHGGVGDDTLAGRGGDDILIAAEGDDVVAGGAGADVLYGNEGDDRLSGGSGRDELRGGVGQDVLTGDRGGDRFLFIAKGVAADADHADVVTDFHQIEHDLIDLREFDADPSSVGVDPFTFVGIAAFSGTAGEIRYDLSGGDTLVSGDTNGDRAADFYVRLKGNVALTAADFLFATAAPAIADAHAFQVHFDVAHPHLHLA